MYTRTCIRPARALTIRMARSEDRERVSYPKMVWKDVAKAEEDPRRAFCSSCRRVCPKKGPWIGLVIQAAGNYNRHWLSGRLFMRYLCIRENRKKREREDRERKTGTRSDECLAERAGICGLLHVCIEQEKWRTDEVGTRKTKIEYPRTRHEVTPSRRGSLGTAVYIVFLA